MLWKTLIKRTILFIEQNPEHAGAKEVRRQAKQNMENLGWFLNHMDVRHVGDLRKLIPEAFPKKLQRLPLKSKLNIHGKWRVDATDKETVS